MINQLKWDVKDIWMRYGWTFLAIPLTFLLLFLTSNRNTTMNHVLITFVTGVSGVTILFFILLGNFICLNWLMDSETQLHMSVPVANWKIFLSKVVLAAGTNTMVCFFALQFMLMTSKFSLGTFRYISQDDLGGIPGVILLLCVINVAGVIGNLLARSFVRIRSRVTIFTILFGFGLLFLMAVLALYTPFELWIHLLVLMLVIEFFAVIKLMQRFAHLD